MNRNITDIKKTVLRIKPASKNNYENIDLDRLVVYTLSLLEESKVPLYFDFITVGLFRLFPLKFSMANFKQYPDTNRINKALRRLTDQKRKGWATGNVENGFYLTALGHEMAKQVTTLLENYNERKNHKIKVSRSRGKSSKDDVLEIRLSEAFKKWHSDENINYHELFAFLKAAPYTPKSLLASRLECLKISAAASKDKEVSDFLSYLEKRFNNLLY